MVQVSSTAVPGKNRQPTPQVVANVHLIPHPGRMSICVGIPVHTIIVHKKVRKNNHPPYFYNMYVDCLVRIIVHGAEDNMILSKRQIPLKFSPNNANLKIAHVNTGGQNRVKVRTHADMYIWSYLLSKYLEGHTK